MTEKAAAWRMGLDAIGKVLGGFLNLGKSELQLLADNLRNLPHSQLHGAQQTEDTQPRRVAQGSKYVQHRAHGNTYKEIFIYVNL